LLIPGVKLLKLELDRSSGSYKKTNVMSYLFGRDIKLDSFLLKMPIWIPR